MTSSIFSCLSANFLFFCFAVLYSECTVYGVSGVALVVKNPPASSEDKREAGSVSGCGRSPGTLFQYYCLENPVDRGAWRVIVHGVTKNQTGLSD